MSDAQAVLGQEQSNKRTSEKKGVRRFYNLFRPSTSDVRRRERNEDKKATKLIKGLTQLDRPEKERFIPVSLETLLNTLNNDNYWAVGERETGQKLLENLNAWRHQSYRSRLNDLKNTYLTFSPDTDTIKTECYSPMDLREMRHNFMEHIGDLLESANYEKVTQSDLDLLLTSDSPYGLKLHVDLDAFDDVVIYFRGAGTKIVEYRDWKWAYLRKKPVETPIFQRLFVALKLKPTDDQIKDLCTRENIPHKKAAKQIRKNLKHLPDGVTSDFIYLKLFKNIPQDDLEMMFPNTKVEFKLWDKIKLGLTAGGGTVAGLVGALPKFLLSVTAAALNPIALLTALVGIIGLLVRQVTKFFHQHNEYMMTLAQNLYFHNLANNRGVLTLLVDRAEEEDIKEEALLYAFLSRNQGDTINLKTAKREIEEFLLSAYDLKIEFDHEDAFSRLLRDGLVQKTEDGNYKILPPEQAINQVRRLWQGALNQ